MADPQDNDNNENNLGPEDVPGDQPENEGPPPEQPPAPEGQQDLFQDEDDFLTADHVIF